MIVYLDTNAYIGAKYIFDTSNMGILKSLISDGKVTLLYSSATVGEVRQHIDEDISTAVQNYNRVLRKDMPSLKYVEKNSLSELDIQEAIESVKEKAKEFFDQEHSICVSLNPLDAEQLMKDYFSGVPPFEKKKPDEFKDAIMINAVKNFQRTTGEMIYVVSNDEGFRRAFDGDENFVCFDFLSAFLKYYNKQQEVMTKITEGITAAIENAEFEDEIRNYLQKFNVYCGHYEQWENNDIVIDEIYGELIYIEEKNGLWCANVSVDVELSMDITYRDEEHSYYDKEEGTYLIENFIRAVEKHSINVELVMKCDVEENEEGEYEVTDVVFLTNNGVKTLDLDEETLIDSEEIDSILEEEPGLEYCSECGKLLGRTADGAYFDYFDNPLCDECMQVDSKGDICPMCGRKIPYEFMMSGFCKDCEPNVD